MADLDEVINGSRRRSPCLAMILDQSCYSHPLRRRLQDTRPSWGKRNPSWWRQIQTLPADPGTGINVNTCSQKRMARLACAPIRQSRPTITPLPITAQGPIRQPGPISAPASITDSGPTSADGSTRVPPPRPTIADGWIPGETAGRGSECSNARPRRIAQWSRSPFPAGTRAAMSGCTITAPPMSDRVPTRNADCPELHLIRPSHFAGGPHLRGAVRVHPQPRVLYSQHLQANMAHFGERTLRCPKLHLPSAFPTGDPVQLTLPFLTGATELSAC